MYHKTCACVIHTILLSYMCINIVSHFTLMFAGVHVLREALVYSKFLGKEFSCKKLAVLCSSYAIGRYLPRARMREQGVM